MNSEDPIKVKNSKSKAFLCCSVTSCLLGLLLIVSGVLVILYFRSLVTSIIKMKVPLTSDSEVTKEWLSPPVKPLIKIYFFNVSNPQGFLQGQKPKLVEKGPYVYEQTWSKVGARWYSNDEEVEFQPKKLFYFRRDLSVGGEEDQFTVPNVPMISALGGKIKYSGDYVMLALGSFLEILRQEPFVVLSVKDMLWGYDNPLVKLGKDVLPQEDRFPFDEFGFFVGKNDTPLGLFRALTGTTDVKDIGQILSFNGMKKLEFWKNDQCNEIKGTDGSVFHPDISMNDTLHIFNRDLCRSLPLVYQKEVTTNGDIPAFRFVPPSDVFGTPEENPFNDCFCVASNGCTTPSGLFNLSICQYGSPIMLSWPHFYQADPRLLETVEGLEPVKEKHEFFIDIQPKLGTAVRASARTQINLVMSKTSDRVKVAKGLRDIIFPLLWFSDGIDGIDDKDTINLIQSATIGPEKARGIIYPTLFALGSIVLLIVMLLCFKKQISRMRQVHADKDEDISLQENLKNGVYKT